MPSPHSESFNQLAAKAVEDFTAKHAAREQALKISREVIRLSANSIRATHRAEFDQAQTLIDQATIQLKGTASILDTHPDIYYSGYSSDARKEFSEASITLAFLSGRNLPQPQDLGVDVSDYLKGLGDAAGELRRYILDSLRHDDWGRCEEMMDAMDELYSVMVTLDFPEGVTGGLRHTTDMVRGTLERTRGDFTMAYRQRQLEKRLASLESDQGGQPGL
ncbi:MAG: haloacid dehalogenase [SAR202 cluster bacterium]|nr:haloacid dehalogenase [SAR202 cluster bacterium]